MEGAIAEANLEDSQPVDLAGKNDVKGLENRLLKLKGIDPGSSGSLPLDQWRYPFLNPSLEVFCFLVFLTIILRPC